MTVSRLFISPAERGGATMLIGEIASLITISVTIYLARRLFDRRSFVSLGLVRSGALCELPHLKAQHAD